MKTNSIAKRPVSCGGQASSPGLFGCPSTTGRIRPQHRQTPAPFQGATAPASRVAGRISTPTRTSMRLAAIVADERERLGYLDDEQADFARRCAGVGYVEATLALEGN